jgi:hypothetical protein
MASLHTEFHFHTSHNSLVTAIKWKPKYTLDLAIIPSLTFHKTFHNSVHGASITPISQISTATILIKLMAVNYKHRNNESSSTSMILTPSFNIIHPLVQKSTDVRKIQ